MWHLLYLGGLSTPKDEEVCIDLLKEVVPSPEGLVIDRVERTEGKASLDDLRTFTASDLVAIFLQVLNGGVTVDRQTAHLPDFSHKKRRPKASF